MMVRDNVFRVRERLGNACIRAGRDPSDVLLVAVTKTFPVAVVREAVAAGLVVFGENRVQEAAEKVRSQAWPDTVRWHLIGHLQRNKAKLAAGIFDTVETVDGITLARDLDRFASAGNRRLPVLLQVNVGQDPKKSGVLPDEAADLAAEIRALAHLDLRGLMTIPPYTEDPERARPFFASLRNLRDRMVPAVGPLPELSMGMSHDFEQAVEEGATIVRVGSALFGERPKPHGATDGLV